MSLEFRNTTNILGMCNTKLFRFKTWKAEIIEKGLMSVAILTHIKTITPV